MAVNLEHFNRIIDLVFYSSDGTVKASIKCPRYGIKPQIEINGTYGAALALEAFHITVKNLYLDLRQEQYSKIKVKAGYANNYITIEADIVTMFQETPGPEGTMVIQCQLGGITKTWLDSTVQLQFKTGAKLTEILNSIKTKLMATDVNTGIKARELALKEPLQFDGTARGALARLEKVFEENRLQVFMQGTKLCAICLTEGDFIKSHILQYMSAPPQQNPGDEAGTYRTMITAPWMPELLPGDRLVIPSQVYIRDGNLVGGASKTQTMEVTQMSFHFGTRGSVNQMTCEGFILR